MIELARHSKLTFLIVLIGLIISELGIQYFIGFSSGLYTKSLSQMNELRTYPIENLNLEEYKKVINYFSSTQTNNEILIEDILVKTDPLENIHQNPQIIFRKSNLIYGIYGSSIPSQVLQNSSNDCIISRKMINYNHGLQNISKSVDLFGITYNILDIIDMTFEFDEGAFIILPFEHLKPMNIKIQSFKMITNKILTSEEFELFQSQILSISPSAKVIRNYNYEKEILNSTSSAYWERVSLFLLLCTISIFNSFILLNFWLENKKKELMCYKICGATTTHLFWGSFFELASLYILTNLISIISFEFVFRKVFLSIGINLVLGPNEYIQSTILSSIAALVIIFIMTLRLLATLSRSECKT
jgi:hypothetical protein